MPVQQEEFTGYKGAYPFEQFADGKIYLWVRGEDYRDAAEDEDVDKIDKSFAATARNWGQRKGYSTEAYRVDKGVEVRFTRKSTE